MAVTCKIIFLAEKRFKVFFKFSTFLFLRQFKQMLSEYPELSISANIYLILCNIESFSLINYIIKVSVER